MPPDCRQHCRRRLKTCGSPATCAALSAVAAFGSHLCLPRAGQWRSAAQTQASQQQLWCASRLPGSALRRCEKSRPSVEASSQHGALASHSAFRPPHLHHSQWAVMGGPSQAWPSLLLSSSTACSPGLLGSDDRPPLAACQSTRGHHVAWARLTGLRTMSSPVCKYLVQGRHVLEVVALMWMVQTSLPIPSSSTAEHEGDSSVWATERSTPTRCCQPLETRPLFGGRMLHTWLAAPSGAAAAGGDATSVAGTRPASWLGGQTGPSGCRRAARLAPLATMPRRSCGAPADKAAHLERVCYEWLATLGAARFQTSGRRRCPGSEGCQDRWPDLNGSHTQHLQIASSECGIKTGTCSLVATASFSASRPK